MRCCFFFFFSSRRRHTIYWRDWSSDVCSSDLSFSTFRHDERNVEVVLARVERNSKRKFGEAHWENKASRPVAAREETKHELERGLKNPEAGRLLSRAEAAYERLTSPQRIA